MKRMTTVEPFPCPPPPHVKSMSGPDVPGIYCYIPDGCCGPSPCDIGEFDLICQVRSLLPEGDPYNNTAEPIATPTPTYGAVTVGCARVGCEQLVMGSCCSLDIIPCQVDPVAPQLAVVDAFGAAAYRVLRALCDMLRELDPCTARQLIRQWAERMGIKHPDPCGPGWSDYILAFLICLITQLRSRDEPVTWDFLVELGKRMGADLVMRYAGDFSDAHPGGWWTMARDEPVCPPRLPCPPDPAVTARGHPNDPDMWMRSTCETPPLSLNIIHCPRDIEIPENCNLPTQPTHLPHDPEMYQAFLWLLPQLLPRGPLYCLYECNPADCVV